MHAIHTTSGFIINSKPYGEAGKVFSIFTRDFGLIMTTAQGIRLLKSKLRYHTQEYSLGSFSLVRGKEFWRLTNAESERSDLVGPTSSLVFEFRAKIASLLKRLLRGEEAHPELFDCIDSCIKFLNQILKFSINEEQLKTLESIIVLRIMYLLGYIGNDPLLDKRLNSTEFSLEFLDDMASKRAIINQHINKALRESHL